MFDPIVTFGEAAMRSELKELVRQVFEAIEEWRSRPLACKHPCVFVDGICLKRAWGGSFENVAVMVAKGPKSKCAKVAAMLKAMHAQESMDASMEKADAAAAEPDAMRLKEAAKCFRDAIAEALTYTRFPMRHWRRTRTNNAIGAAGPRDPPPHARGGYVPRRQERVHAGDGQAQIRDRQRTGIEEVSKHVAAG